MKNGNRSSDMKKRSEAFFMRSYFWNICAVILNASPFIFFYLFNYHELAGDLGMRVQFWVPLSLYQISIICFVVGAFLSNRPLRYRILRVISFLLMDFVVSFIWYALWHPESIWTAPLSAQTVLISLMIISCICFIISFRKKNIINA